MKKFEKSFVEVCLGSFKKKFEFDSMMRKAVLVQKIENYGKKNSYLCCPMASGYYLYDNGVLKVVKQDENGFVKSMKFYLEK